MMPKLVDSTRKQLLLNQLLAGILNAVSHQIWAAGETKDLETAVECAGLLLALNKQDASTNKVVAVMTQAHKV